MAAERCPLCQSKLKNGECASCGYRLPDEGGISAYYNYDPSDYPQEQPAVREITPEHQMEEIYPNRPEPINLKVRNDEGKTVQSPYGQQQNYYGNNGQNNQNDQNSQKGQFAGYFNNKPYYHNPAGQQQYNGSSSQSTGDLKDFLARYWWILLISFFFPFIGAVLYAVLIKTNAINIEQKYRKLVIIIIVLGFILPPWT